MHRQEQGHLAGALATHVAERQEIMMSDMIEKMIEVRWDDVDSHGHLRNSRILDYASYARISYFQSAGFPVSRMEEMGLSMMVLAEDVEYCNGVSLGDYVTVQARAVGLSADGSRWHIAHTFLHSNDQIVAILHTLGSWFDTNARKLTAPPPELMFAMDAIRSEDCEIIGQHRAAEGAYRP